MGNFEEWISYFESIAATNKWSEEERVSESDQLTEKAHLLLTSNYPQTYEGIKGASKDHFKPSSKQEVYKARIKQNKKTESWGDLGDDLL